MHVRIGAVIFLMAVCVATATLCRVQAAQDQAAAGDDSEVRPAVTKTDLEIVEHARRILDTPAKWNRADNRKCPDGAKAFSLYCALEKATYEVTGSFEHRGAAMQEARFVIEEVAPDWKKYDHRLMDYNNDPKTNFADVQKLFQLLHERIERRLKEQSAAPKQ